jgi:teichoic acid transport system ATP-binding protein
MSPEEVREKYDGIVEFSGIGDFIELPMRTYSSGMAARLRFAIAAAKAHEVLLIDEALSTGDRQFRRRSRQRMHELREQAGTVFLVSHSLDVIAETCNRAVWLEQGRIRAQGDAQSVIAAYSEAE